MYRITGICLNDACICQIDWPQDDPVLVTIQRLTRCLYEVADEFWSPKKLSKRNLPRCAESNMEKDVWLKKVTSAVEEVNPVVKEVNPAVKEVAPAVTELPNKGKYAGRLRGHSRMADVKPGDM